MSKRRYRDEVRELLSDATVIGLHSVVDECQREIDDSMREVRRFYRIARRAAVARAVARAMLGEKKGRA